jgi:hypothetical protein
MELHLFEINLNFDFVSIFLGKTVAVELGQEDLSVL